MFQPGGEIVLPPPEISNDVDAEGELGVILRTRLPLCSARTSAGRRSTGSRRRSISRRSMSCEGTRRYLTRAKSIDTFFSFGPVIVTTDEVADIGGLEVVTEHNGMVCSKDYVRNMKMGPLDLIAFHSGYFTWEAGDVLSTGCPKGARIKAGDRVRARIDGVGVLDARVR